MCYTCARSCHFVFCFARAALLCCYCCSAALLLCFRARVGGLEAHERRRRHLWGFGDVTPSVTFNVTLGVTLVTAAALARSLLPCRSCYCASVCDMCACASACAVSARRGGAGGPRRLRRVPGRSTDGVRLFRVFFDGRMVCVIVSCALLPFRLCVPVVYAQQGRRAAAADPPEGGRDPHA